MAQARYGDADLKEFKALIEEKLEMAREDLDQLTRSLSNIDSNNTNDTAASFKLMEETAKLATRQEKFVESLENALMRIRNKTYGLCRVTGKLIQKERLKLVPHATLSIEAKRMQ
jgi:DnaK suppressor protein